MGIALALAEATWVLSAVYDKDARDIADAVEMLVHPSPPAA